MYSISEAAKLTGLSIHTLRFYESSGLLPNIAKDAGGRRSYSEFDIKSLTFIKALRQTNMPVSQIRHYGELYSEGKKKDKQRRALLESHRDGIIAEIKKQKQHLAMINKKLSMSL
jgi:DNA-binding transcriptional MerR regulator